MTEGVGDRTEALFYEAADLSAMASVRAVA